MSGLPLMIGTPNGAFVLRSELDELIERLSFEKDRLEKDEAIYALTDCDAEASVDDGVLVLRVDPLQNLVHLLVGADGIHSTVREARSTA